MDYDVRYANVALRLPFNETDGATSVTDASLRPKTVTLVNAEVDDAVALFGRSLKLVGNGRLQVASHADFDLGTGEFMIDFAVYPTTNTGEQCLLSKRSGAFGWLDIRWTGTVLQVRSSTDGTSWNNTTSFGTWTLNTWNRIRISRTAGGTAYYFLNGVYQTGSALGNLFFTSAPLCFGAVADGSQPFTGWIDEVRIKKGQTVTGTASYTPLGEEFDVTGPWVPGTELDTATRRVFPAWTPLPKVVYHRPLRALRNFLVPDGEGRIVGTVREKNTPANTPLRRRVVLLRDVDAQVLDQTFSDAVTGAYEFKGLRLGLRYTVLAFDHLHNYRAVVADNLEPVL